MALYASTTSVNQLVEGIWKESKVDRSAAGHELMCAASKIFTEKIVSEGWKLVIKKVSAGLQAAERFGYIPVSALTSILCIGQGCSVYPVNLDDAQLDDVFLDHITASRL